MQQQGKSSHAPAGSSSFIWRTTWPCPFASMTSGVGAGMTANSTCFAMSAGMTFGMPLRSIMTMSACSFVALASPVTRRFDCAMAASKTIFGALVGE